MHERIAIIDLGSNSARLVIIEIFRHGGYNLIYQQKEVLRLSQGSESEHIIQLDAWQRALETLQRFANMCRILTVDHILAVATAAVRNAKNGAEFIADTKIKTGLNLSVISGEQEAYLGYLGVINTIDIADAVIFDLGGGSTEISLIKNRQQIDAVSLPLGAVNTTEMFNCSQNVTSAKIKELQGFLAKKLNSVPWLADLARHGLPLIGIGGTARNIAKISQANNKYPLSRIHNYKISQNNFNQIWQNIAQLPSGQRAKIAGLSHNRTDLIIAGSSIIKSLFDHLAAPYLLTSGFGLRDGLFFQYYLASEPGQQLAQSTNVIIPDILDFSARNLLRQHNLDERHALHVAGLAKQLFNELKPLHQLSSRQLTLLTTAALLHDTGIVIDYYSHPRHSTYIIENANLFGLSHREQAITSLIAGWHHNPIGHQRRNRVYQELLTDNDWLAINKLAVILALSESLDINRLGNISSIEIHISADTVNLSPRHQGDISMEINATNNHKRWFAKEFNRELVVN